MQGFFQSGIISNAGIISESLIPAANNSYNLGSLSTGFSTLFLNGRSIGTNSTGINITTGITIGGGTSIAGNIVPSVNNSYNLGAVSTGFNTLFLNKISITTNANGDLIFTNTTNNLKYTVPAASFV
jgi:hypothetical protein